MNKYKKRELELYEEQLKINKEHLEINKELLKIAIENLKMNQAILDNRQKIENGTYIPVYPGQPSRKEGE